METENEQLTDSIESGANNHEDVAFHKARCKVFLVSDPTQCDEHVQTSYTIKSALRVVNTCTDRVESGFTRTCVQW